MIKTNERSAVPEQVLDQVKQVQQSKKTRDRGTAILVGAMVLVVGMLAAMLVDSWFNLFSLGIRTIMTVAVLAGTAVVGWQLLCRSRQQNERLVSAAKDVDATYPVLQQRISTLTSCDEDFHQSRRLVHPAMLRRVSDEASNLHRQVQPKPIVSRRPWLLPLSGLGLAGLFFLGMLIMDPPKTLVQLGRFWAPWSSLSVTGVDSKEGDHLFARGEPLKLTATLTGRPVEKVLFLSRSIDGSTHLSKQLWPSTKDRTLTYYRQPKASDSFDYRFRAGDGQSNWHRVTVADRPKIEDLVMRITPPAYTGRKAKEYRRLPKKLRTVVGSTLEISLKPHDEIRTARLVMGKTDWLPLEADSEDRFHCTADLQQNMSFQLQLTEIHGLANRRPPRCNIQVVPDHAPKVKILKPTRDAVVLPDETIDIHYQATDDFAIKDMALRVYTQREGDTKPTVHEVAIPVDSEKNARKVKGVVQLDLAQFELKDGDSISYEVRASDNFKPATISADPETDSLDIESIEPADGNKPQVAQTTESPKPGKQAAARVAKAMESIVEKDDLAQNNTEAPSPAQQRDTRPGNKQVAESPAEQKSLAEKPADDSVAKNTPTGNNPSSPARSANPEPRASTADTDKPVRPVSDPGEKPDATGELEKQIASKEDEKPADFNPEATEPAPNKTASDNGKSQATKDQDPANNTGQSDRRRMTADAAAKDAAKEVARQDDAKPNSKSANAANSPSDSQSSKPPASATAKSNPNKQNPSSPRPSTGQSQSKLTPPPSDQEPDNAAKKPDQQLADAEKQKPFKAEKVEMTKRMLDVGQSSSSGQRKVKVDEYAGSYRSKERKKLEIAIAPTLAILKSSLIKAGNHSRSVMQDKEAGKAWSERSDRALSAAANELKIASEAVVSLTKMTGGTPYAFVGLKMESIRLADIAPAWEDIRLALKNDGDVRQKHVGSAWHHINRALESLAALNQKFDQVKRDQQFADKMIKFKKMHRVFVENALATLDQGPGGINKQQREGAEFDLDEEYLKRLKEVLEMRRDMMAELAKILSDDPQLLRRYMNSVKNRSRSLRDQLTVLAYQQKQLAVNVERWADAATQPPPSVALNDDIVSVTENHLLKIPMLANDLADISERFSSWLPLEEDIEKGEIAITLDLAKQAGSKLSELVADIETIGLQGGLKPEAKPQLSPLLAKADIAKRSLKKMDQSLRRITTESQNPDLTNNALRRLNELRNYRFRLEQWQGKLGLLTEGLVQEVYAVDQENGRDDLLEYVIKITTLETQLATALQSPAGEIPDEIAKKSKAMLQILDVQIPATQLTAAQALLDADAKPSVQYQTEIANQFESAEKLFDEIMQGVADELDKLPPEDPIASLLRDPTLDEILARLEREQDFLETLGLSGRPSNLQIIQDWMRPGSGGGGGGGGMSSMLRRLMQERNIMRKLSNQGFRKAQASARVKGNKSRKVRLAEEEERWNLLVGKLGDGMIQGDNKTPPERYRSAINHYFEYISKLKNSRDDED